MCFIDLGSTSPPVEYGCRWSRNLPIAELFLNLFARKTVFTMENNPFFRVLGLCGKAYSYCAFSCLIRRAVSIAPPP